MKLYEGSGPGFLIMDTARQLRRSFQKYSVGSNLTLAQSRALVQVARNPGIRQAELADWLDMQAITLARLVGQLETKGVVERRLDPLDRRAYQLHKTATADRYLEAIEQVLQRIRGDALAGLDDDEVAALYASLKKVNSNLEDKQEQATEPLQKRGR